MWGRADHQVAQQAEYPGFCQIGHGVVCAPGVVQRPQQRCCSTLARTSRDLHGEDA